MLRCMLTVDDLHMAQVRPDPRGRKIDPRTKTIADLRMQVLELKARLAEAEKLRMAREKSLLEHGLRLSQENEVLRREIASLKKSNQ